MNRLGEALKDKIKRQEERVCLGRITVKVPDEMFLWDGSVFRVGQWVKFREAGKCMSLWFVSGVRYKWMVREGKKLVKVGAFIKRRNV